MNEFTVSKNKAKQLKEKKRNYTLGTELTVPGIHWLMKPLPIQFLSWRT